MKRKIHLPWNFLLVSGDCGVQRLSSWSHLLTADTLKLSKLCLSRDTETMESFPYREKITWFCLWGGNYLWTTLAAFLSDLTAGFIVAFPRHQCSLEDLGGTPLNVVWVSSSELCPWCWERGKSRKLDFSPACLSSLRGSTCFSTVLFSARAFFSSVLFLIPALPSLYLYVWFLLTNAHRPRFNCLSSFWWVWRYGSDEQINKWIPQAVNGNRYNLIHNWQNH